MNMNKQGGYTIVELLTVVIVLLMIVGWIMNIVAIVSITSFLPLTGVIALRIIGVFVPPLGAIMGLFF